MHHGGVLGIPQQVGGVPVLPEAKEPSWQLLDGLGACACSAASTSTRPTASPRS